MVTLQELEKFLEHKGLIREYVWELTNLVSDDGTLSAVQTLALMRLTNKQKYEAALNAMRALHNPVYPLQVSTS